MICRANNLRDTLFDAVWVRKFYTKFSLNFSDGQVMCYFCQNAKWHEPRSPQTFFPGLMAKVKVILGRTVHVVGGIDQVKGLYVPSN